MTASTDLTASGAGRATSSLSVPAQEMADQMADVAGAMFALLLLRAPDLPAHKDVAHPLAVEPAGLAVALEEPLAPVLVPSVPALAVAIAALDLDMDTSPALAASISIAMPTSSLPMPELIAQIEPEAVHEETSPAFDRAIPLTASTPAPTMAMLSEIGFLDE